MHSANVWSMESLAATWMHRQEDLGGRGGLWEVYVGTVRPLQPCPVGSAMSLTK